MLVQCFIPRTHKKCWKLRLLPAYEVRCTQTLVKIYNKCHLSMKLSCGKGGKFPPNGFQKSVFLSIFSQFCWTFRNLWLNLWFFPPSPGKHIRSWVSTCLQSQFSPTHPINFNCLLKLQWYYIWQFWLNF